MHPRTILAIARKDAIDILLNKSMLAVLILPIVFALLFLFMGRLISGHTYNMLVYNPGHSALAQVVSQEFDHTQIIEASTPGDVTAAFGPNGSNKDAAYDVGLIVPADFEAALRTGSHPQVSLYINGSNLNALNNLSIQTAIVNYARQTANPQPPVALSTALINPPSTTNIGELLSTFYGAVTLLCSFIVGSSLMPGLLIEEKEKKTLRMLMVTPASFTDVILGKLLVVLIYQLILSLISVAIVGGFTGQVPLILLYLLIGSCLSLAIGLLLGGAFQSASTAGAIGGMLSFIYVIPAIFSGPIGASFGSNPIIQLIKIFPTYYIADGAYNAMQGQGTLNGQFIDLGVPLAVTLVLLALTTWILRRQSSVAAAI
ncbi:MAG TPA: ABC transporter permease [Ktedonobacteraceae bacterium]